MNSLFFSGENETLDFVYSCAGFVILKHFVKSKHTNDCTHSYDWKTWPGQCLFDWDLGTFFFGPVFDSLELRGRVFSTLEVSHSILGRFELGLRALENFSSAIFSDIVGRFELGLCSHYCILCLLNFFGCIFYSDHVDSSCVKD